MENANVAHANIEFDPNAFMRVQAAMFVALGGAMGTRTLLNAATLLAGLSRDASLDPNTRKMLDRLVAAADANVAAELAAPEPTE
jgi:hypothetical protein